MLIMFFAAIVLALIWNKQKRHKNRRNRTIQRGIRASLSGAIKEKWKCSQQFDNARLIALIRNHQNRNKQAIRLSKCLLAASSDQIK